MPTTSSSATKAVISMTYAMKKRSPMLQACLRSVAEMGNPADQLVRYINAEQHQRTEPQPICEPFQYAQ